MILEHTPRSTSEPSTRSTEASLIPSQLSLLHPISPSSQSILLPASSDTALRAPSNSAGLDRLWCDSNFRLLQYSVVSKSSIRIISTRRNRRAISSIIKDNPLSCHRRRKGSFARIPKPHLHSNENSFYPRSSLVPRLSSPSSKPTKYSSTCPASLQTKHGIPKHHVNEF